MNFPQDNDYRKLFKKIRSLKGLFMSTIRVYTSPIGELSSPKIKSEERE